MDRCSEGRPRQKRELDTSLQMLAVQVEVAGTLASKLARVEEVPRSRKRSGIGPAALSHVTPVDSRGRHNSIYHLGRRGHAWARLPPKLTAARRLDDGGISKRCFSGQPV